MPSALRRVLFVSVAFSMIVCLTSMTARADAWPPSAWFKKKTPHTLIVTGNYLESRLLAELVQYHTKQPILLLPSGKEKDIMYFMAHNGNATAIKKDDFQEFVEVLHPQTVVFLGNEDFAPQVYVDKANQGLVVSTFRYDDWNEIAASVGKLMDIKKLQKEYQEELKRFDYKGRVIEGKDVETIIRTWKSGDSIDTAEAHDKAK